MMKNWVVFYSLLLNCAFCFGQDACDSIYQNPDTPAKFINSNQLSDLSTRISSILCDSGLCEEAFNVTAFQLTVNKNGEIIEFKISYLMISETINQKILQIISKEFVLIPGIDKNVNICSSIQFKSCILLH